MDDLSLVELSRRIRDGEVTPVDVVEGCLARVAEREDAVRAWSYLAADEARGRARTLTEELATGSPRSVLHGMPFAVKDIYDTAGMPTEWGTPVHRDRVPASDAKVVADLASMGAIVLGKTHTTAYAYFDPAPTMNPHNPAHTPGGSSSGSAAAVADGMVPLALGSQTQGSVLRPASFCGVCGLKPTFGALSAEGVMPFSPTLDHPGLFARTVGDMVFLWRSLKGVSPASEPPLCMGVPKWPIEGNLEPEMAEGFARCLERLREDGYSIEPVSLPDSFANLPKTIQVVMRYEAARIHGEDLRNHGTAVGEKLALLLEDGLTIRESDYDAARTHLDQAREDFAAWTRECPIWATPAAVGPAPHGLETTGDPSCNAPFTALGVPSVSLPFGRTENGLPLGLQLSAPAGGEDLLLAAAQGCEDALGYAVKVVD